MTHPIATIQHEFVRLGRHLAPTRGGTRRTAGHLETSAYTLLTCLNSSGPLSIAELSAQLGLDTSTVNRQTAALVANGYAERRASTDGGSARKFHMTELGTRHFEEERIASEAALQKILSDWSETDRAAFAGYLTRYNEALEYRFDQPWPRTPTGQQPESDEQPEQREPAGSA